MELGTYTYATKKRKLLEANDIHPNPAYSPQPEKQSTIV